MSMVGLRFAMVKHKLSDHRWASNRQLKSSELKFAHTMGDPSRISKRSGLANTRHI